MRELKKEAGIISILFMVILTGCISKQEIINVGNNPSVAIGGHSLISWNIHKELEDSTSKIKTELKSILNSNNSITCLQEVIFSNNKSKNKADFFTSLGFNGVYSTAWRFPYSEKYQGVMTLNSKNFSLKSSRAFLSPFRECFVTSNKSSLVTNYEINGKKLTVINVHGLNFLPSYFLKSQLNKIPVLGKNVILAGDFNTWSDSKQDVLDDYAIKNGLIAHKPNKNYSTKQCPFLQKLLYVISFTIYDYDKNLDHIYSKGIDVKTCDWINNLKSSDHKPLKITFDF